ncbi:hypothetical protein IWW34DRAFT_229269 [Fusarium oxysporum f. sp. albedinis]|nr:hypothetical protein IWW34DRAFT_229269 [Fusarium oxysporum f. sp. albedinis]KAJ0132983.1 hypothetical protein HZ326_23938 [Fusarium oxysporum f. sp. albedinis]
MTLTGESAGKITLRTSEDWTLWADQFKSKAKRAQLWEYIVDEDIADSSSNNRKTFAEVVKAPKKPLLSQFKKKTASGSRSISAEASSIIDLHPDDIAIWTALTVEYNSERKDHELILKRLDNLQEWIRDTVTPEHLRRWCTADKEVDEWYFSLNTHLGIDILDRKTRARQAYADVLAMPRRKRLSTKKEVEEWLSKWDTAYN